MTDTRYKKISSILYLKAEDFENVKSSLSAGTRFSISCENYAVKSKNTRKLMFSGRYYCGDDDNYHFLITNDERRRLYKLLNGMIFSENNQANSHENLTT